MTQENQSKGLPTRSNTKQAVQTQKIATSLKFQIIKKRSCSTYYGAKTKALISCVVTENSYNLKIKRHCSIHVYGAKTKALV